MTNRSDDDGLPQTVPLGGRAKTARLFARPLQEEAKDPLLREIDRFLNNPFYRPKEPDDASPKQGSLFGRAKLQEETQKLRLFGASSGGKRKLYDLPLVRPHELDGNFPTPEREAALLREGYLRQAYAGGNDFLPRRHFNSADNGQIAQIPEKNNDLSLRPPTKEEHWNFINGRYAKQVRKIENPKEDPFLKNPDPTSTAKGLYQMTENFAKDGKDFLKANDLFPLAGDAWSVENQNKIFHSKLIKDAGALQKALGRKPADWEVYISHFLGVDGFKDKFLKEFEKDPGTKIDKDSPLNKTLNRNPGVKQKLQNRNAMTYQGFADYYKEMFGEGTTWDVLNSRKLKEARTKDGSIP